MRGSNVFSDAGELAADLVLLESLRAARKSFVERICQASAERSEAVLGILRLEATYHFAEFFYQLRARCINTAEDITTLAELHNQYIVDLMRDETKMARLGLTKDRLLDAMFTADTLPRLVQAFGERPGAIDQSNLARLLFGVMSTETCRKIVVACAGAGFLERERTPYGTMLVRSSGVLENLFGNGLRDLRQAILTKE